MQQVNVASGFSRQVCRRYILHPVYALHQRSYWASVCKQGAEARALFEASADEASFPKQLLLESLPSAHILSVRRVENGPQHDAYLARRSRLVADLSAAGVAWDEDAHARWAFHGTAHSTVDLITRPGSKGFDYVSPAVRNGCCYGHGVYLALAASLAHRYTAGPPAAPARRLLILCRALVGRAGLGRADEPRIPLGCHSLCDSLSAPTMFVVQDGAQACPCFVVEYVLPPQLAQ